MDFSIFRRGDATRVSSYADFHVPSERTTLLIQGLKTGLAAGLCYWLSLRFGLHEGYWSAISAIIVLQSNVGSTIRASRDRIIGTALGAVLGFIASPWQRHPAAFAITVTVAMVLCGALQLKNSARLAGVTICIVMLVQRNGSHWRIAIDRFFEVALGILIALVVSTLIWPTRARQHLRYGVAQEFQLLGHFFDGVMTGFRSTLPDTLQVQKHDLENLLRANEALLQAARNEPATGPASTEALSLLVEFGQSLMDAILALELAVRDSDNDQFAARVEPELSNLVIALTHSFPQLAKSIRFWHFRSVTPGIDLESDQTALGAKVLQVRKTSLGFPLDEVLRIYAVQLHLKRIVRLLQVARSETLQVTRPQEP
jgi:uncharacterized membrane protein YccC